MYSRTPSDEQAVKSWLRDYSGGLASVGIKLSLTSTQQCEMEHRLLAVYQRFDTVTAIQGSFKADTFVDRPMDPIRGRWLHDHIFVQGGRWTYM
jgi:hypothetical protein